MALPINWFCSNIRRIGKLLAELLEIKTLQLSECFLDLILLLLTLSFCIGSFKARKIMLKILRFFSNRLMSNVLPLCCPVNLSYFYKTFLDLISWIRNLMVMDLWILCLKLKYYEAKMGLLWWCNTFYTSHLRLSR